jgi:hypothetical protein
VLSISKRCNLLDLSGGGIDDVNNDEIDVEQTKNR